MTSAEAQHSITAAQLNAYLRFKIPATIIGQCRDAIRKAGGIDFIVLIVQNLQLMY